MVGVARVLLLCAVLLVLPSLAAAQCISQLSVQRVWTQDAGGADKSTFAPGEPIRFAAELNNAYGAYLLAANGTQLAITTSFYTNTSPVDIPPGINTWIWNAIAPSGEGNYTVTVRAYDHFCGVFPEGSGSLTVGLGSALPDLSPTAILYNPADLVPGRTVFFDSGVQNSGSQGTGVFNVRWLVDGVSVGYGSHAGVPANSTILDGNSQFSWVATAGTHTIEFAVDVDNHVVESNESNNSRSVTVTEAGQSPMITLLGDNPRLLTQGCPLVGAGATATDVKDGDLTDSIIIDGSVDINAPGGYTLTYSVTDSDGFSDVVTRQVIVFGVIGTPVCFVGRPAGKAPNLVVIVHGCCTDSNDVVQDWDYGTTPENPGMANAIGDRMTKAIKENIHAPVPEQWEIVVWDWTQQCPSEPNGECTPKNNYFFCPECFPGDALAAYFNTELPATNLITAISPYPYRHIHMIGHSAGAALIDIAAKNLVGLYNNVPSLRRPFIHLTFLDAFTLTNLDTTSYGFLPNYPNHYSEHYVDRTSPSPISLWTNSIISNAYNFDITDWNHPADPLGDPFGHQWPRHWYQNSAIATPGFEDLKYGFPFSLEGGGSIHGFTALANKWPLNPPQACILEDETTQIPSLCDFTSVSTPTPVPTPTPPQP